MFDDRCKVNDMIFKLKYQNLDEIIARMMLRLNNIEYNILDRHETDLRSIFINALPVIEDRLDKLEK